MQTQTINLRRGAFGQPSVPFLLSRRAHLLTTPKGRWYFLRKPCALRGGCGFCGSLWTMPQLWVDAVIVHAVIANTTVDVIVCWGTSSTPTCDNCLRKSVTDSFIADMDGSTPPIFFLRKRNKNRGRKDGENEWQSTIWKQRS